MKEQIQPTQPDWLQGMERTWDREWEAIAERKAELAELGIPITKELGRAPLKTEYGGFTFALYGDRTTGYEHEAMVFGDTENGAIGDGEDMLVRIHSACKTSEAFHAVNCECREEMHEAMESIAEEGRGIFIYLQQEGRGTGSGKLAQLEGMLEFCEDGEIHQKRDPVTGERIDTDRAYKEAGYPTECRDFDCAGEILQQLGVKSVRMLTNNPRKIEGIEKFGIGVEQVGIHIKAQNGIVKADLLSKAKNLGHYIEEWQV